MPARVLIVAVLALVCPALADGASAHHRAGHPASGGVAIPHLAHGQLPAIAAHRGAIIELAVQQTATDRDFRRLMNFARIQHAYCLWGLVPGSLADEQSGFNECTHAYLAATRALLDRMLAMPAANKRAGALAEEIDRATLEGGGGLALCRFSDEAFSTAEVIRPDRASVLRAGFLGAGLPCAALIAVLLALRPRALPRLERVVTDRARAAHDSGGTRPLP